MADIAKTVAIIFQGQDNTGPALAGVESGIKGIGSEASGATSKVGDLDKQVDSLSTRSAGIASLNEAFKALAIALVFKDFVDANIALEQFNKTMTIATGSSKQAAIEYEFVRQTSNKLGLELRDTAEAYAKFSSATAGSALAGEATKTVFTAFAGTMSAVGATSADVAGAMVQLSQGISKGKFELEDLKSIAERVPGFFNNFAKSLGVSTDALFEMISAGKITGAEILKFAETMNKGLDSIKFDGYINEMNRLRNAVTESFNSLGQSGAFEALTKGVQIATAAVVGAVAGFQTFYTIVEATTKAIRAGDLGGLGDIIAAAMDKGANQTRAARDAMLSFKDNTDKASTSVDNISDALTRKLSKGTLSAEQLEKAAKGVDTALKALGIDPKKFEEPIQNIVKAFDDLAKNPAVRGDQLLSGLLVTLDKITGGPSGAGDLKNVADAIESAFKRGALSASEYAAATNALQVKQSGLWDGMIKTTGSAKDQQKAFDANAKATEKAKDEAAKYALELEKLASNERIKLIESKVKLDVAEFEYKAKIVEAAFTSINTTIDATSKNIGDLWKLMDNPSMTFSDKWALEDQIEKENILREKAFKLQEKLIEATLKEIELRTKALANGDALIKIDGAGLQPHLEAFMWEILRTIQTRVNADGLKLLLGT